jgi:hypothetical protein
MQVYIHPGNAEHSIMSSIHPIQRATEKEGFSRNSQDLVYMKLVERGL